MTVVVLLVLAVIWAAVLLPPYLQNRSESRPADSISTFQRQLSVLEHRSGSVKPLARRTEMSSGLSSAHRAAPAALRSGASAPQGRVSYQRALARKRRRDVLFTLAGSAAATLLVALVMGGPVWIMHLLVDALLVGYVMLLVQIRNREAERTAKVTYLPQRRAVAQEPQLMLRRSGS